MICILHIETSTNICSASLSADGKSVISRVNREGQSHAAFLGRFVDDIKKFADSNGYEIDAVSLSSGPGSYTGLRIGTSLAKGLCYALDIPLISIPTLQLFAYTISAGSDFVKGSLICPLMDARRNEVYAAVYDDKLNAVKNEWAEILTEDSFSGYLKENRVFFGGNGAGKAVDFISSGNASFTEGVEPLAENMISLAEDKYKNKDFASVAYLEPFYLKDFKATVQKKNILVKNQ